MIGKVQDVVSAAVVVGAVTKNEDSSAASRAAGQQVTSAAQAAVQQEEAQQGVQDAVRANVGTDEEQQAQQKQQELNEDDMKDMMKELNELMNRINCNLQFQYHKEVNVMSVKMIDKSTHEVIKEMPPEEMIKNLIQSKEWIGAFLDKNA